MISDKHKCIHIHITKSAGTSINHTLCGKNKNNPDLQSITRNRHLTAIEMKNHYVSKEKWNNYFKFAIVRNPFDRMVSSYNWVCRKFKPSYLRDRLLFENFVYKKKPFEHLTYPCLIIKTENKYHQIKSATDFVMDENNKIMIDYVGRFENIEDDWNFICKQLGIKIKLKHLNKHSQDHKHYRDYYNDETKQFVAEACKKDLETFGYEF